MANERRLIDANELLEKLSCMIDYCENDPKVGGLTALFQVGDAIMDCHTVDAVEVVRCKDCKYYHMSEGWCDKHSHFIDHAGLACHPWESSNWKMFADDHYCADGKRRSAAQTPKEDV